MTTRRMILSLAAAATLVGASTSALAAAPARPSAPGSTAQAGQAAGCEQPYEPWFAASTYPAPADVPDLGDPIGIDTSKPDTDGDGTPDTIVDAGNGGTYESMTIARGDGTITLTPGAHDYVYLNSYGPPPGDLDGDGRDELFIGVDQQGQQYILPGTTAPGTHAIDEVGITPGNRSQGDDPVGDQDGDGADDVAYRTTDGFEFLSGVDLMAPGPGGPAGTLDPITTYTGSDLTAAVLADGEAPTIITGARVGDQTTVTVHGDPPVELTASGLVGEYTGGVGSITVHERDGDILVAVSAGDRGGSSLAVWNLTDPCSRYAGTSTSTTTPTTTTTDPSGAAPASPVSGAASYTG
jgi:hypothetical protein